MYKIVQSGAAIGGIGEVEASPLANAYFRLIGKRVRSLPMFSTGGG